MRREIPEVLKRLREAWFGDDVPSELQFHVRFASGLSERGGRLHVVRFASAGQGTIIEEAVDREKYDALRALMDREYFPREYADAAAAAELGRFLERRGVELKLSKRRIPAELVTVTREVCEVLPEEHFGDGTFHILEIGGWGHGAAKASEYLDGKVHLFSFAVKGPRRNYAALLLHEIGHAGFARLERTRPGLAEGVREDLSQIRALAPHADREMLAAFVPFALDYLLGPGSRVEECIFEPAEFAAELYLMYVVRGAGLKDRIAELPPELASPWRRLYEAMREGFGGVEYA